MEQIERIMQMERCLDQLTEATKELTAALDKYDEAQTAANALRAYLNSGEWRKDYEADEAGLLPADLKRGVLSQDGIWNVMSDCRELDMRMAATMQDNDKEVFPIVDEEGRVTGSATRGECHNGSRLLHPVVHLHVFSSRGEVYLQKRPEWKDIQPGKWDTAVGGHMDYGETPEEALRREVSEELGITDFTPERIGQYVFDSQRERELVYVNRTTYDGPIHPSDKELDGGRFWHIEEIREAIGQGILTPNFESEFQRFFL